LIDSNPSLYTLPLLIPRTLHQSYYSSGGDTPITYTNWDASFHAQVNSTYGHQNKIDNTLEKVQKRH